MNLHLDRYVHVHALYIIMCTHSRHMYRATYRHMYRATYRHMYRATYKATYRYMYSYSSEV